MPSKLLSLAITTPGLMFMFCTGSRPVLDSGEEKAIVLYKVIDFL